MTHNDAVVYYPELMKKWLFGLLLLVTTSLPSLQGLPLGNPAESTLFGEGVFCNSILPFGICENNFALRVGYYGDFVFNRKMKVDGDGSGTDKNISNARIITNAAYLVLNFCNRLDLFATLGSTRLTLEANGRTWFAHAFYNSFVRSKDAFSWSIGSRAVMWSLGCFHVGLEGQYLQTKADVDSYRETRTSRVQYPSNHSTYREWQVGVGLTYEIGVFSTILVLPYVGVKWADCKYITGNINFINTVNITGDPVTIFNMKAQRHWGIPLGVTVVFSEKVGLEIETRWLDEWAFSAKAQMQF